MGARDTFICRGGVSVEAFDVQMDTIEKAWSELKEFYGLAVIDTLVGPNNHEEPEVIYDLMYRIQ